jgi:hypothetical protein
VSSVSSSRESRHDRRLPPVVFALLVLWALAPIAVAAVYASRHGGQATGAFSSLVVEDQFQYFAWIRESGDHLAISNLFNTSPPTHVFVYPPFLLSGALWRLGLPLAVAYHLWTLVAAAALTASVAAYARRFFSGGAWSAAVVLAIVFGTPVAILGIWVTTGSHGGDRLLAYVLSPLSASWGYLPRLLSVALMPAYMLAVERVFEPRRGWLSRPALAAGLLGLAVAWLHPWQGLILVLATIGLAVWCRLDEPSRRLAVPLAMTAAPLVYYAALRHFNADWRNASKNADYYSGVDVLIILGPFLALAALGLRRPGEDVRERLLLLWPAATAVAFAAPTGGRFETVAGLSIPLSILIVRGWQRLAPPRALTVLALAAMLLGAVVPLLHDAPGSIRGGAGTVWLRDADRDALRFLAVAPGDGSVLADSHVAASTVAFSGRRMWAAVTNWSPDYVNRATLINEAVAGRLSPAGTRRLAAATGAGYLYRDCERGPSPDLARRLGSLVRSERRFGCAQVLRLTTG